MPALLLPLLAASAPAPRTLDLQAAMHSRSLWRLTVTQAPDEADPFGGGTDRQPGRITLCLSRDHGRTCDPAPRDAMRAAWLTEQSRAPRFVQDLRIVRPPAAPPMLLIRQASAYSGDGDQLVATQLLAYDAAHDRFRIAFQHRTGHNNNQEVRYIDAGPLAGAVIVAEPTTRAPFGFEMTVNRPTAAGAYRPVLRYRSATRYGDGNRLAVIDSEMPGIRRRLGLWHPGRPLPLPAGGCAHPQLRRGALWCEPPPAS